MSAPASRLPPLPSDRTGLPGTRVEIVRAISQPPRVRAVVFDFDGTLSLIREGWPEIMIPMLVDELLRTPRAESAAELRQVVEDFVMRLNGKQTIYQMIQLAEEVTRRGGDAARPGRVQARVSTSADAAGRGTDHRSAGGADRP